MSVIVGICRKYFIMSDGIRRIDNNLFVLVKKGSVLILQKAAEHGSVFHIMAVDQCVCVFKVSAVIILRIDSALGFLLPVYCMGQIIAVVIRILQDRIINGRSRYGDPGICVRISLMQCVKVNGDFRRFRILRLLLRFFCSDRFPDFIIAAACFLLRQILPDTGNSADNGSRSCNSSYQDQPFLFLHIHFLHE